MAATEIAVPSDLWGSFYPTLSGAILQVIGSVIAAFFAAYIAYRLASRDSRVQIINSGFLGLSRAVEGMRICALLDHLDLMQFKLKNYAEYQKATSEVKKSIVEILYCTNESVRDEITVIINIFLGHINKVITDADLSDEDKRILIFEEARRMGWSEGIGFPPGAKENLIKIRENTHSTFELDLDGRTDGALRDIRRIAERERAKVSKIIKWPLF